MRLPRSRDAEVSERQGVLKQQRREWSAMTRWPDALDLAGDAWLFASVAPARRWRSDDIEAANEWLPASVPGNLESDLQALGQVPNLFGADDERWFEQRDWWYRRAAQVDLTSAQRAHLLLHGVDYYSAVYANGALLGCHEGMFSPQVYELTPYVQQAEGELRLAVRLWGAHALPRRRLAAWQRLAEPLLRRVAGPSDFFPSRIDVVKCQMSFGWDFAPRLPTIGVWDDAEIAISGPVFIADIWPQATSRPPGADVTVQLRLDAAVSGPALARLHTTGPGLPPGGQSERFELILSQGGQTAELSFVLDQAHLWQPWDQGQAALYRLGVEITPASGPPSRAHTSFGIRSIGWALNSDGGALTINDWKEFIRGANWVPADALPGRLRAAHYNELIALARQANVNLLRVWGGGLREKRAFYDECDRLGMLVWQELPHACPGLRRFPTTDEYLRLAETEATAIVRSRRNHPSLVMWCGGNEFSPRRNRPLVERLRRATVQNDGTRPFLAASPSGGDRHCWDVWHRFAPLHGYRRVRAPLVSEFGLQSLPVADDVTSFVGDSRAWPPNDAWVQRKAEIGKLLHYATGAGARAPQTLEDLCAASQRAQAQGVQIMVEHMRRRRAQAAGVIVWQLNEPWPCISWSLIGHNRRPKLAYHMLARVYAPLLLSVEYPMRRYAPGDRLPLVIWLIDDQHDRRRGQAITRLWLNDHEVCNASVTLGNEVARVADTEVGWPSSTDAIRLRAELWQSEELLCWNEYDLSYSDARETPLVHRLLALAGRALLH